MQTSLNVDSTFTARPIGLRAHQPVNPCTNCLSKSFCLHKSIDIQKLIDTNNHYVQKYKVKKGDSIFLNGDDHSHLYNVRMGHIKIEHALSNGQSQVVEFGMAGDLIGLDGWADGKHHLDAYALDDAELCSINVKQFQEAVKADKSLLDVIEQLMSAALNHSREHIFSLGIHGTEQKLANFLIDYRNRLDHLYLRLDEIRLPMSREELRSYLGMTIETLSRSFTYLEDKGYISVKNRYITFLDHEKLKQFLEPKEAD